MSSTPTSIMIVGYMKTRFAKYCISNISGRYFASNIERFQLPSPHWSFNDLRILGESSTNVIDAAGIDKLAKLSCINLDATSRTISKQEICKDINVILNCARILQDANSDTAPRNEIGAAVSLVDLREDVGVAAGPSVKITVLQNSFASYNGYLAVPKIRDV